MYINIVKFNFLKVNTVHLQSGMFDSTNKYIELNRVNFQILKKQEFIFRLNYIYFRRFVTNEKCAASFLNGQWIWICLGWIWLELARNLNGYWVDFIWNLGGISICKERCLHLHCLNQTNIFQKILSIRYRLIALQILFFHFV